MRVADDYPTVKSSVTDGCILEGHKVSLTCKVKYNGTNLMPLRITWVKYTWYWSYSLYNYGIYYHYTRSNNTANASSVYQSTLSFTAEEPTTENYVCRVTFSYPTGLVLPGVQKQSTGAYGTFTSLLFRSRTVASTTVFYVRIILHSN